jgi:hypothetical protein
MIIRYACVGLVAQWALLAVLSAAVPDREALRDASDSELNAELSAAMSDVAEWDRDAAAVRDRVLLEIARRGGDE